MTVIRVDHAAMKATADLLSIESENLRKAIKAMKEAIEPLAANWFPSGSPTGLRVNKSQQAVDEAMAVITSQLAEASVAVAQHSGKLAKDDAAIAGG